MDVTSLYKWVRACFNWFGKTERGSTQEHLFRGFSKAFLMYWVPATLLRRKFNLQTVRRGVALGVFVSGVRLVDDLLTKLKEQRHPGIPDTEVEAFVKKYSLGVSGFVSALIAAIIDGEINTNITIVLWAMIRAIRLYVPTYPWGPTALMCVSAAQILSTWLSRPEEHNQTYLKFITHHGGHPEAMQALWQLPMTACEHIHPTTSHLWHFISFYPTGMKRAFKVYAPVFLVTMFFSHKKNFWRAMESIFRSSLFLTSYCALAWASACLMVPFKGNNPLSRQQLFCHTWIAGLATPLETPGRQAELAAYCMTYAAETVFHYLERRGYITLSPSLNLFVLAFSAGALIHYSEQQPQVVMRWLFKITSRNNMINPV